jgi:hypothetical protein
VCGCEVFETGFSTVEKLLTLLFRESLLISRARFRRVHQRSARYLKFISVLEESRAVVKNAIRGPWFVTIFRRSHPELHLAGREVEAPKLKALRKLATPQ